MILNPTWLSVFHRLNSLLRYWIFKYNLCSLSIDKAVGSASRRQVVVQDSGIPKYRVRAEVAMIQRETTMRVIAWPSSCSCFAPAWTVGVTTS